MNAPNKQAQLTTFPQNGRWSAFYEPGYDGSDDSRCIISRGDTKDEAIVAYWEEWEERYGINA